MAKVSTPASFVYRPDPSKSLEENMKIILDHMGQALTGPAQDGFDWSIRLDIEAPMQDAQEMKEMLDQAVEDAAKIEELQKLAPVSIDKDGQPLYKLPVKK